MTQASIVREILADLTALIWPTACVACGAPDRELCGACREAMIRHLPPTIESRLVPVPTYARAAYAGALRSVVIAYKHGGRTRFAKLLGAQLEEPLRLALAHASDPRQVALVAAPSRASQVRRRGFRHIEMIARAATKERPVQQIRALKSTRGRRQQVGLDSAARTRNAARLEVRRAYLAALQGREIVLIDDVLTTGATAHAACQVLAAAGARVVAVAVLGAATYGSAGT